MSQRTTAPAFSRPPTPSHEVLLPPLHHLTVNEGTEDAAAKSAEADVGATPSSYDYQDPARQFTVNYAIQTAGDVTDLALVAMIRSSLTMVKANDVIFSVKVNELSNTTDRGTVMAWLVANLNTHWNKLRVRPIGYDKADMLHNCRPELSVATSVWAFDGNTVSAQQVDINAAILPYIANIEFWDDDSRLTVNYERSTPFAMSPRTVVYKKPPPNRGYREITVRRSVGRQSDGSVIYEEERVTELYEKKRPYRPSKVEPNAGSGQVHREQVLEPENTERANEYYRREEILNPDFANRNRYRRVVWKDFDIEQKRFREAYGYERMVKDRDTGQLYPRHMFEPETVEPLDDDKNINDIDPDYGGVLKEFWKEGMRTLGDARKKREAAADAMVTDLFGDDDN